MMSFAKALLAEAGIKANHIDMSYTTEYAIPFMRKNSKHENIVSTYVNDKDGRCVGYIRLKPNNDVEMILARRCLMTDFFEAAKVLAQAVNIRYVA